MISRSNGSYTTGAFWMEMSTKKYCVLRLLRVNRSFCNYGLFDIGKLVILQFGPSSFSRRSHLNLISASNSLVQRLFMSLYYLQIEPSTRLVQWFSVHWKTVNSRRVNWSSVRSKADSMREMPKTCVKHTHLTLRLSLNKVLYIVIASGSMST